MFLMLFCITSAQKSYFFRLWLMCEGQTERRTDRPSYRDARTQSKFQTGIKSRVTGKHKVFPPCASVGEFSTWMRMWMLWNIHRKCGSFRAALVAFSISKEDHFSRHQFGSVHFDLCISKVSLDLLYQEFWIVHFSPPSPPWCAVSRVFSRPPTDRMFCHIHWIGTCTVLRQCVFSCGYAVSLSSWTLCRNLKWKRRFFCYCPIFHFYSTFFFCFHMKNSAKSLALAKVFLFCLVWDYGASIIGLLWELILVVKGCIHASPFSFLSHHNMRIGVDRSKVP